MGGQKVYQQRSVSQQQQDFCGQEGKGDHCGKHCWWSSQGGGVGGDEASKTFPCTPPMSALLQECRDLQLRRTVLDVVQQAAVEEGRDRVDGPNVVLVFPPLDEGNEPRRVQVRCVMVGRRLGVFGAHESSVDDASRLEPRLLQAGQRGGPSLGLTLEQQADKVLGGHAHSLKIVLREAEVQAADVQTRLL